MRLCIFITICACLVFAGITNPHNPTLEILGEGEYSIYTTQYITSPLINKTRDLGYAYIYTFPSKNAEVIRPLFSHIDGESLLLTNTQKTTDWVLNKLNYKTVSQTTMNSTTIIYAHSPRAKTFVRDGNKKINMQISRTENTLIIGWPVILGSY